MELIHLQVTLWSIWAMPGNDNECTNSVSFNVRAFDDDCGRLISEVFTVTRGTTVPTIVSGPMDMTVECDNIPEVAGPEAIVATDNCGEEVTDAAIKLGPFPGSCTGVHAHPQLDCYGFVRYDTVHEQTITVKTRRLQPRHDGFRLDSGV